MRRVNPGCSVWRGVGGTRGGVDVVESRAVERTPSFVSGRPRLSPVAKGLLLVEVKLLTCRTLGWTKRSEATPTACHCRDCSSE